MPSLLRGEPLIRLVRQYGEIKNMPSPEYRPDEDWVYASNCEPEAGITAGQLRDIADELDRLNGNAEAAEEDGTYSLKGLSRNQLLEITQIVGTSKPVGSDAVAPLERCISALGYGGSIEELEACKAECDAAFPVSA